MPKRPRDPNQLAKMIVGIATGEMDAAISEVRNIHRPEHEGGLKGVRRVGSVSRHSNAPKSPAMAVGLADHVGSLEEIVLLA